MWTLQEGIFAHHLYFQPEEGPVSPQLLVSVRNADERLEEGSTPNGTGKMKTYRTADLARSLSLQGVMGEALKMTKGQSIF